MDIGRVFARSLELAWRHKFLWVFGFIMALTGGGNGLNYSFNRSDLSRFITPSQPPAPSQPQAGVLAAVLIIGGCFAILYLVLMLYFRFVARGALVTSIRTLESGLQPTVGSAWREGNRYYLRLLGLGFLFWVPLFIITLLVILAALIPFVGTAIAIFRQLSRGQQPTFDPTPILTGVIGFLGLLCCGILCLLLLNLVIHPVYEFAVRGIVLEETGVIDGLGKSSRRLRSNLGSVVALYVILIGSRIGWAVVMLVVALPVGLLLLTIITAASAVLPWWGIAIVALAFGVPVALAFAFLGGLFEVFESNVWTEAYLALLASPALPLASSPAGQAGSG